MKLTTALYTAGWRSKAEKSDRRWLSLHIRSRTEPQQRGRSRVHRYVKLSQLDPIHSFLIL